MGGTRLTAVIVLVFATAPHAAAEVPQALRANIAWQIALDRVGYSPGVIDGCIGAKTKLATRELQRVRGLPVTGMLDAATAAALNVDANAALTTYTISARDFDDVGPVPSSWLEKSQLPRLNYESMEALLAERFHCTRGLLRRLNPGQNLTRLTAGSVVRVPAVSDGETLRGQRLLIDLDRKVISVLDARNRLVALFHCSIARQREKRPSGETKIKVIARDPTYTFDPDMWPEVTEVDRKLTIPPGPRNPVGLCWIGLRLPGYGIHGTPQPEMIGKSGSHGCFRLTNWDALRLADMVRVGAEVQFVGR